jgi:hypothetical protein
MSLSAAQLAARDGKLTASRVGVLMSGDDAAVLRLWNEMLGQSEPDDLSRVWPVQLGTITETLNLDWYQYRTGHALTQRGAVLLCAGADWAACTLDGFDEQLRGPVEAKHVGGFEPRERIIARYQPQLHWQMIVSGETRCALSIIEGAREPAVEIIERDGAYSAELWRRAEAFMQCVWNLTPPCALGAVTAPAIETMRELDMAGSNSWAAFATDWLASRDAAKTNEKAAKELKALVPADVGRAYANGIQIKRARNGALTISQARE